MSASTSRPCATARIGFFLTATMIASSFVQQVDANVLRALAGYEENYVLHDVECTLYLSEGKALMPETEDDNVFRTGDKHELSWVFNRDKPKPNHVDEHDWVCTDIIADTSATVGMKQSDLLDLEVFELRMADFDIQAYIEKENIQPGASSLYMSSVVFTPGIPELYIPKSASIRVDTLPDHRRKLAAPTAGVLSTLMVRIIGSNGYEPTATKEELFKEIFRFPIGTSMAQQFRACSGGIFDVVPWSDGEGVDGILDLEIPIPIEAGKTPRSLVTNLASVKLRLTYGSYEPFGLVMFCFPGGTLRTDGVKEWLAFALTSNKLSFYNDDSNWCRSTSLRMHEVGHNMNLAHSAENKAVDDAVGLMGISYPETKSGFRRMCFNAAKNYQLQWYTKQEASYNPLTDEKEFVKEFTMVSVNRYAPGVDETNLVDLRLETPSVPLSGPNDWYIGFNEQLGFNDGTMEDSDKVIVWQKEKNGPFDYGVSIKRAVLNFGESYTIANYDNQNKDVKVKFVDLIDGVATVQVTDKSRAPPEEVLDPNTCPPDLYPVEILVLPDMYPDDVSWSIVDQETRKTVGFGNNYKTKWKMGETVEPEFRISCVPYNRIYEFIIKDLYGDGICCFKGAGYYKGLDPEQNVLFQGGSLAPPGTKKNYGKKDVKPFISPTGPANPTKGPTGGPPPTGSPPSGPAVTSAPTKTPTIAPLPTPAPVQPTNLPTSGPQQDCTDDPNFQFNGVSTFNCAWVAAKKDERCGFAIKGGLVEDKCQKTCGKNCTSTQVKKCKNKKIFFRINKKRYKCNTFEKNKEITCQTKIDGKPKTVASYCKAKCNPECKNKNKNKNKNKK